jgi:hypothetical protein
MRKSERARWAKRANALIESFGATLVDEWYPWRLETRAGPLVLLVEAHDSHKIGGPGAVFTRFEGPSLAPAKELVDCNPHSGKWNHHYFDGWTAESALMDLAHRLRSVV